MLKKQFVTVLVVCFLFTSTIFAQGPFQVGINFTTGIPQNEFADNVDNTGFGGSARFLYNLPSSALSVGATVGFLVYGTDTRNEQLSPNIPEVTVDVNTSNNIFMSHVLLRLQSPRRAFVKPYLIGMFGFNYLFTETTIKDEDDWGDDDDNYSSTNFDDITFSYGGGGGLAIKVYDGYGKNSSGLDAVNIDIGLRFIAGGEAEYLKKGDILRDDGNIKYNTNKSTTDLLTIHVGVSFDF